MKTLTSLTLLLISLLGTPFHLSAQEIVSGAYYVSPTGNDTNDGRLTEEGGTGPWRTIQHAAQTVIAGDTVYVREGVFTEPDPIEGSTKYWGIRPANDGAASMPIVYSAYPGEKVVIDMKDQAPCFSLYGRQYITIHGFELTNCVQGGVWVMSGSGRDNMYINITNNLIHNIDGNVGNNVAGVRIDDAGYSIISDNIMFNIRVGGVDNGNAAGVLSYGMYETLIANNKIFDVYSGIFHKIPDFKGRKGGVFTKNIIHDVERAFYFNNNNGVPETAVHFNTEISQNIVYDASAFIFETTDLSYGQSKGLKIYNNTINNAGIGIRGFSGVEIKNNIFYGSSSIGTIYQEYPDTKQDVQYPSISLSDYNIFHPEFIGSVGVYSGNAIYVNSLMDWKNIGYEGNPKTINVPSPGPDQNSIVGDPLFTDVFNNDYHLTVDSPARNFTETGRSAGAYITGDEIIGPRSATTTVARPNPPKLFQVQ